MGYLLSLERFLLSLKKIKEAMRHNVACDKQRALTLILQMRQYAAFAEPSLAFTMLGISKKEPYSGSQNRF